MPYDRDCATIWNRSNGLLSWSSRELTGHKVKKLLHFLVTLKEMKKDKQTDNNFLNAEITKEIKDMSFAWRLFSQKIILCFSRGFDRSIE